MAPPTLQPCVRHAARALSRRLPAVRVCSARSLSISTQPAASGSLPTAEAKRWSETVHERVLSPLNERLLGPLERSRSSEAVPYPFVLLLGNHSSGKSSFINYVLGRPVQATGVAPTDDGFTVIVPGEADSDRDGASFIGDPSMGFSALRAFGPGFMSHFTLKASSAPRPRAPRVAGAPLPPATCDLFPPIAGAL